MFEPNWILKTLRISEQMEDGLHKTLQQPEAPHLLLSPPSFLPAEDGGHFQVQPSILNSGARASTSKVTTDNDMMDITSMEDINNFEHYSQHPTQVPWGAKNSQTHYFHSLNRGSTNGIDSTW